PHVTVRRKAQNTPPCFRSYVQRKGVHRVTNTRIRPRTNLFREPQKIPRHFPCQQHRLVQRIHQDRQRPFLRPPFHPKNLFHRRQIKRICRESVHGVCRNRHYFSALQPFRGVTQSIRRRRLRADP